MFTLLKDAELYCPEYKGRKDILIADKSIVAIESDLMVSGLTDLETIHCNGKVVSPGLIDQHVHLTGGGGEAGFASRTPQVSLEKLILAGSTTVIGVLGTDGISRSPQDLYAKAASLTSEGISAFMHTGSYEVPTKTITGSIRGDITFIPQVLGVKIALADHRCSFPTTQELARIVSDLRIASMLSGKRGVLHIHMGGLKEPFKQINELLEMGLPIHHFSPTHVGRTESLFQEAIQFALAGGYIDITSGGNAFDEVAFQVKQALEAGVDSSRITLSSDGNGSLPSFDKNGKLVGITAAGVDSNLLLLPILINHKIPVATALSMITSNVADSLGLQKGRIKPGYDADLCIFNDDFTLDTVIAKGQTMLAKRKVLVKGHFC